MRHVRLAALAAVLLLAASSATAADRIRIAVQKTGTLAWELDVIKAHGLDRKADLHIETIELATTEAGKIALRGGSADLMLSDWLWVARERALGDNLVFYPYSSTLGAVMVPAQSPIKSIADLKGKQARRRRRPARQELAAAAGAGAPLGPRSAGRQATIVYGAPPLLSEKALQGETDATLTFWNFCAELEGQGHPSAPSRMDDVMRGLGAKAPVAIVGYVFDSGWAARNRIGGRALPRRHAPGQGDPRHLRCRMAAACAAHRRARCRPRSRSIASAIAKASCAARSPKKRPTRARSIACWPRSAAPTWWARRASSPPARSTGRAGE